MRDPNWSDRVEVPRTVFEQQHIELDFRGTLIIEPSHWGWDIKVYTRTHNISKGVDHGFVSPLKDAPVIVRRGAWIGSNSTLYNCTVGEGAVVAAGTVLRSCEVAPHTMVAGNPPRVIARWHDNHWDFIEPKWTVLQ